MYQRFCTFLLIAMWMAATPLFAQQPCLTLPVAIDSNEDRLMLAVNGADNPQDQLAALDKYAQDHADSRFMPCVNEYYASINLKLGNFDKSIEYAEKDLAANYQDLNLLLNLMRAYVASNKVSDTIFDAIDKAPDQIKVEASPARPPKASDADWEKIQSEAAELAKESRSYAVYAFFQLLQRVTDGPKRVQIIDNLAKVYPEAEKDYASQLNAAYFQAYQLVPGKLDTAVQYGEKSVAADPNNLAVLNTLGLIYAFYVANPMVDKAADYAQKARTLAEGMKKPEGVDDATFKREQNSQLGMAHLTLGYAAMVKLAKTKKLGPAIDELKMAGDLLEGSPALQGQALYYLAYACESEFPAKHHEAIEALSKAETLPGPWQTLSHDLLAKVRARAKE
jgi:tetratricopeptide (TPR) repeat protein